MLKAWDVTRKALDFAVGLQDRGLVSGSCFGVRAQDSSGNLVVQDMCMFDVTQKRPVRGMSEVACRRAFATMARLSQP